MGGINYDATVQTQDCNITTIIVAPNSAEKEFEIPFSDWGAHSKRNCPPTARKGDRDEGLGSFSRPGGKSGGPTLHSLSPLRHSSVGNTAAWKNTDESEAAPPSPLPEPVPNSWRGPDKAGGKRAAFASKQLSPKPLLVSR